MTNLTRLNAIWWTAVGTIIIAVATTILAFTGLLTFGNSGEDQPQRSNEVGQIIIESGDAIFNQGDNSTIEGSQSQSVPPVQPPTRAPLDTFVPSQEPTFTPVASTAAPALAPPTTAPTQTATVLPDTTSTHEPVFRISKTADTDDLVCDADCSVREAIRAADPGDTVLIPAGIYTLTIDSEITIDKDLILEGNTASDTIIQAAPRLSDASHRVIRIVDANVTISRITIRHGKGNGNGGGILNEGGALTIIDSEISGNNAKNRGGGIHSQPTLTLINSTVKENSASGVGGVYTHGEATLLNSTIYNNTSANNGGIFISGEGTITNSTISTNTGGNLAGGVYVCGRAYIRNSTIAENNADWGGGIYNNEGCNPRMAELVNTILAGNKGASNGMECWGTALTSRGHNLLGNSKGCSFTKAEGDRIGSSGSPLNALLGPLQDNGGSTMTHALLEGSPAINAGDDSNAPDTDQRGVSRPQAGKTDIGAHEFEVKP